MEGALEPLGLDHMDREAAREGRVVRLVHRRVGKCSRMEVKQPLERIGLRDVQVVAGDQAELTAVPQKLLEYGLEEVEPAVLDERRDHGGSVGAPEQGVEEVTELGPGGARGQRLGPVRLVSCGAWGLLPVRRDPLVVPARGQHVPDASLWVLGVPVVAGDDVHVQMGDGLAGRLACVEADVVSVGVEVAIQGVLHLLDEGEDGLLFFWGGFEPRLHDPAGDDEGVAFGDGVVVADREGEVVGGDPGGGGEVEEDGGHRRPRPAQMCSWCQRR